LKIPFFEQNMKTKLFAVLSIAIILASCGKTTPTAAPTSTSVPPSPTQSPVASTRTPIPTFTPVCISSEPTQQDIDRAITFTGDVLAPSDWQETYEVVNGRVSVTLQNTPESAVAFIEAVIFPCGYEEPDLNNYFSEENWKAIFQNYDTYNMEGECKSEKGIRLYQFKAFSQGYEYAVRYWVVNDTDSRIITVMLTFPSISASELDNYSIKLFPDLPNCS
jgi:hypothetical protein